MPKPTVGTPNKRSEGCHLLLVMRGRQRLRNFMCMVQVILEVLPPGVARVTERTDQNLAFERMLHLEVFLEASVTINFGWYTSLADV